VERVALEVCEHRGWSLLAAHARTTHVHVLITARAKPEDVLRTIKAWATRRLVEAGAAAQGSKVWSRHGSTVYLWSGEAVERAEWYVRYEQDEGTGWG
jgi:REP element-mobilizing transposase RayT